MTMKVWASPSEALLHGACAICLGGGETFDIVLGRVGKCSGCGGTGLLDDMLARNCDEPDCPDHPRKPRHLHLVSDNDIAHELNVAPVCPGCGAVAELNGPFWETAHVIGCTWMADPDSEPYD
jgi:hypothetical protein